MTRRFLVSSLALVAVATSSVIEAHPGHRTRGTRSTTTQPVGTHGVSGQGTMRFRVLYGSEKLPEPARQVLTSAHGGFAVDRRPGRGEVYFSLPGVGLLRINRDLQRIDTVATHADMRDVNLHNTTLWEASDGTPYLTMPANDAGRVFTTTLSGELVNTLAPPTRRDDLGHRTVNDYFAAEGTFNPTDVEHFDGRLYVTTGYSDLDWVLTARLTNERPVQASWSDLSFGGRGTTAGLFGTGHGITLVDGVTPRLEIADRPHAEIDRFSVDGTYLSTLGLPAGAFPCDIDYAGGYAVVGALYGQDRSKGAPVYVLQNDRVVSEIWPKEELGLEGFQHIHNAVITQVDGRFYIIVQSWNPGDFAVLEQVLEPS